MRKCEPRTVRTGNPVISAAQSRLEARKRAGVATDEALSGMMSEYIETVRGKSGELNVKKKNISPISSANYRTTASPFIPNAECKKCVQ